MNTEMHLDNSYYHDNTDDKSYFGSFLNLAQNNIDEVFDEFCLRLSLKRIPNIENCINSHFKDEISHSDWERRIKVLSEYFPVIERLDLPITDDYFERIPNHKKENEKREYFRKSFTGLVKTINDLRNFYTHYYHSPIIIEKHVYSLIDKTLASVAFDIRKKKMKTDNTKEMLKSRLQSELDILFNQKMDFLRQRKREGKRADLHDKVAIYNSIYNDAFQHIVFKDKDSFQLRDFHKSNYFGDSIPENNTPISLSGLVFLLSLFLSRKETEQLKANIKGFKAKVLGPNDEISNRHNSLRYMATQWIFSYLSFKGLKRRVSNKFVGTSLLTQMLDELSKIPDEVYQTLSDTDKKEFLEDMNEYIQEFEDSKSLEGSTVIHSVIRKRYENRFNYFAIRFLDEFANFPSLKFQIYAGRYQHDKRDKTIAGSNFTTERIIKERINVFGKLSNVIEFKNDFFQKEEETNWELFPNPSYNFMDNNLHIYVDLKNKELEKEISEIRKELNPKTRGKTRITKEQIATEIYKGSNIGFREPTAILSLNELQALLYEFLINKKTGEELESIIIKKIVEHYQVLKNYTADQKLSNSQIPRKFKKNSTKQVSINYDKLIKAIEHELEITKIKKQLISDNRAEAAKYNNRRNEGRKYIFYSNEKGQEALWIANDFLRFMPKNARAEWKGYQHSEFQRLLAFYETNHKDAKELMSSVWNFNAAPVWGTDIAATFNKSSFDDFYHAYLTNREIILQGFNQAINSFKAEPKILKKVLKEVFIVFNKRFYTINSLEKQKKEILAKPIVFPRGVFDAKPTFIKGKSMDNEPELFADWYQYSYDKTHQFQKFYAMNREYLELYEEFKVENKEAIKNEKKFSPEEKFSFFKMKQDLSIKKVMQKDLFIKLMADYVFKHEFKTQSPLDFTLQDIYQTKAERIDNQLKADLQKDRLEGDYSENVFNDNFIWNKTVPYSLLNGQVEEPKVKLKNIGKLRALEADIRVKTLLSYDRKKVWTKLMINDELENRADSYERIRRESILKLVQQLEKDILKQYDSNNEHPMEFEINGNPNFRMYIANGVLRHRDDVNINDLDWLKNINRFEDIKIEELEGRDILVQKAFMLILIRNKFGHNELPSAEAYHFINKWSIKTEEESYSNYYFRICKMIKEDICT